jgi:hypothetical protein
LMKINTSACCNLDWTTFIITLLLHRPFWKFTKYYKPTNVPLWFVFTLKFTLKRLKSSYMFRSSDHHQGAYTVPC